MAQLAEITDGRKYNPERDGKNVGGFMEKALNDLINKSEQLLQSIWEWRNGGLTKEGAQMAEKNLRTSIANAKRSLQQANLADA